MSKKYKENSSSDEKSEEVKIESRKMVRIAIFLKNHVKPTIMAAHMNVSTLKSYPRNSICWDEKEIDELIESGAPIEVFFRYVD